MDIRGFLSDRLLEQSPKYNQSLILGKDRSTHPLPRGWEILVELNNLIMQYGLCQWKISELKEEIDTIQKSKIKVPELKKELKGIDKRVKKEKVDELMYKKFSPIDFVVGSIDRLNKSELIMILAKFNIYERYLHDKNDLNKKQLIDFIDENIKELRRLISLIPPGQQGLLMTKHIGLAYHVYANLELLNFSNPLYTVFAMNNAEYYKNMTGHGHFYNQQYIAGTNELIVCASLKTLVSMRKHALDIMNILLSRLFNVRLLNHACNINPIVNIILEGNQTFIMKNHSMCSGTFGKAQMDVYIHGAELFALLIRYGLEDSRGSISKVKFDTIMGWRGTDKDGYDILVKYHPFYLLYSDKAYFLHRNRIPLTYFTLCVPTLDEMWSDTRKIQRVRQKLALAQGIFRESDISNIPNLGDPGFSEKIVANLDLDTDIMSDRTLSKLLKQTQEEKFLFDAEHRLTSGKLLYGDEYLTDEDVAKKIRGELDEMTYDFSDSQFRRSIPSKKRVQTKKKERKSKKESSSKRKTPFHSKMLHKIPTKIDYTPSIQFRKGIKVKYNIDGEQLHGLIQNVDKKNEKVILENGDEVKYDDIIVDIDENYWGVDGGGKRRR